MKPSVLVIYNPTAKRASEKKVIRAFRLLKSQGYEVELRFTEQKGDAERFAREGIQVSHTLIIAAGGDGTFSEVINGIVGSEVPMAILPLGTTNVLAKELGIPESVEGAMEVAINNTPKTVSLGKISITRHSLPITRYFVLWAGIGFDGTAVFEVNETIKRFSGKGAYIYSTLKALSGFNPGELILSIDGETYSGYSAVIANASKYGGHFKMAPHARVIDPVLYTCLFKGNKRLDIVRYVSGIAIGRHIRFKDVAYVKTNNVEIKGDAHIQIDGDYFGKTPAKVEIVPDIVRVIF